MAVSKTNITSLLQEKKIQNYSFSIGFFLIFSLFVYFAIRPNLITAFNLEKEKQDLKLKNKEYEEQILQIVNYQSTIEQYRDQFYLLDEAVPPSPDVTKVISDIKQSAAESGIQLTTITMEPIEFTKDIQQYEQVFDFTLTTGGKVQINQFDTFLKSIINQRRIKSIENLQISRTESEEVGGESFFTITLTVKGFYL